MIYLNVYMDVSIFKMRMAEHSFRLVAIWIFIVYTTDTVNIRHYTDLNNVRDSFVLGVPCTGTRARYALHSREIKLNRFSTIEEVWMQLKFELVIFDYDEEI